MRADLRPALIVLLRDAADATALTRLLDDLRAASSPAIVVCPEVRGVQFFAAEEHQADLDAWWRRNIPGDATPIYVIEHERGMSRWLRGVDGVAYVGVPNGESSDEYTDLPATRLLTVSHPLDYAVAIAADLGDIGMFDRERAARVGEVAALTLHEAPVADRTGVEPAPDPFELLSAMTTEGTHQKAGNALPPRRVERPVRGPVWLRLVAPLRVREPSVDEDEMATLMAQRGSTIVAVGSRKGGVGKTSHAAGIAIAAGGCLDRIGHQAAIIDANLANPDAWGQLALGQSVTTVRMAVDALLGGHDVPAPVHAATPALACFPEGRGGTEYSRLEISRFAQHLRSRYTFIVIDMSNRLPDATGGPEATAAAYWLQNADVVVLPTGASKQDFNSVLDYLEVPGLPPSVVAHIEARSRRNREHPLARRYLEAITRRASIVVQVPDEGERVRYAVLEGVAVKDVSSRMRNTYLALTRAVLQAADMVPA